MTDMGVIFAAYRMGVYGLTHWGIPSITDSYVFSTVEKFQAFDDMGKGDASNASRQYFRYYKLFGVK